MGNKDAEVKQSSSLFGNTNNESKGGFTLFTPLYGDKKKEGVNKDDEKKPQFSGSLFGSKPSSGGLFGANTASSGGTGLFGNASNGDKPAGSLLGNNSGASGSLFGGANNNGSSLFGNKDAANGSSGNLFGGQSNGLSFLKPTGNSSLFGNKPTGSLFGQNKSLFGEGFGKAPEKTDKEEDG